MKVKEHLQIHNILTSLPALAVTHPYPWIVTRRALLANQRPIIVLPSASQRPQIAKVTWKLTSATKRNLLVANVILIRTNGSQFKVPTSTNQGREESLPIANRNRESEKWTNQRRVSPFTRRK